MSYLLPIKHCGVQGANAAAPRDEVFGYAECRSYTGTVDPHGPVEVGSLFTSSTSESRGEIIASFPLGVCVSVGLFSLHKWRSRSIASELV